MEKTYGYQLCEEFATKVKKVFEDKAEIEQKLYKTDMMKDMVKQEIRDDYIDILTMIQQIQRKIDNVLEG